MRQRQKKEGRDTKWGSQRQKRGGRETKERRQSVHWLLLEEMVNFWMSLIALCSSDSPSNLFACIVWRPSESVRSATKESTFVLSTQRLRSEFILHLISSYVISIKRFHLPPPLPLGCCTSEVLLTQFSLDYFSAEVFLPKSIGLLLKKF